MGHEFRQVALGFLPFVLSGCLSTPSDRNCREICESFRVHDPAGDLCGRPNSRICCCAYYVCDRSDLARGEGCAEEVRVSDGNGLRSVSRSGGWNSLNLPSKSGWPMLSL